MRGHTAAYLLFAVSLLFSGAACQRNEPADDNATDKKTESAVIPETTPGIPVEVMVVREKSVEQNMSFSGVMQPHRAVDIVAEVTGKVESCFKKLGDRIMPKDTIAVVDDRVPFSNYRQAQSQVLSAENNLIIARLNFKSDEDLYGNGDISKLEYENSRLAVKTAEANHLSALANLNLMEKNYQDTRIQSPIPGRISREYIDLGTMVSQGMVLYRVVDLSVMKVELGIPQAIITHVQTGTKAKVTLSAVPGEVFDGAVRYVSPQADENTGGFAAEIYIKNTANHRILAGMSAKVDLILSQLEDRITVPEYALVSRENGEYVYKVTGNNAGLTMVVTGETFGSQVVVDDGLADGDTLVVVGMDNLGVDTKIWIEAVH